jgi:HD superfamily phosphohydrolase YqeK
MSKSSPPPLHPLIKAAAKGRFPDWAEARGGRRKHMARVAKLLKSWAEEMDKPSREVSRWMAAGYLHDVLRNADPDELRLKVDRVFRGHPGPILHGPAVARRLRKKRVKDEELLHAISYHTVGSPDFAEVGLALYAADFLEPGRSFLEKWRRDLRLRFPVEPYAVVGEILRTRIRHRVDHGRPLREDTVAFWNRMTKREG